MRSLLPTYAASLLLLAACHKQVDPITLAGFVQSADEDQLTLTNDSIPSRRFLIDESTLLEGGAMIEGNITATAFSGITTIEGGEEGFLLRLEYNGVRIAYAPAMTLAALDAEMRSVFTDRTDLLIVGMLPSFSGTFGAEGINPDTAIVIAQAKNAPTSIARGEKTILDPENYHYQLK